MALILAVDDKEDNLLTLSAVLKSRLAGCEVITALSGQEGLAKARAHQPDTIVLDIKMPGIDGYEVCKRLKQDNRTQHIPVIMISAIRKESEDLVKGLACGADAYLAKPIDELVLIAQVNTALRIKRAEESLRRERDRLEDMVRERTAALLTANRELRKEVESRTRTEAALRESEARFFDISHSMADWIWEMDQDGLYTYVSEGVERILGYTRREMLGRAFFDFMPEAEAARVRGMYATIRKRGGKIGQLEHGFVKKDGSQVLLVKNGIPVFDGHGHLTGYRGVDGDITEKRALEQEKAQMERQLHLAQRLEAIGTLAGGIAHDFNNILAAVLGYTELALDEVPVGGALERNLREVYTAGKRARDLVKQILTFARQADEEIKPIRIDTIAKEVMKLLRSSIPATIDIRHHIESDSLIMGNPTQVHQIFMNLCTNAAYAMDADGGILLVSLVDEVLDTEAAGRHEGLHPGAYVRLSVSDTGTGIPEEIIDSIFEPYFTTKGIEQGTGLGLSTVHGIVADYGGAISVDSRVGEGSVFNVYFPIIKRCANPESCRDEVSPSGAERILLVDDEMAILEVVSEILERLGYTVTPCTGSKEALALFRASPHAFDLVITDMTMPGMTGDRLAEALMKVRPDIPIILCTGYSGKMDDEQAGKLGIKAFAYKPLVKRDLALTVRRVLDDSRALMRVFKA